MIVSSKSLCEPLEVQKFTPQLACFLSRTCCCHLMLANPVQSCLLKAEKSSTFLSFEPLIRHDGFWTSGLLSHMFASGTNGWEFFFFMDFIHFVSLLYEMAPEKFARQNLFCYPFSSIVCSDISCSSSKEQLSIGSCRRWGDLTLFLWRRWVGVDLLVQTNSGTESKTHL